AKSAKLKYEDAIQPVVLAGDRAALKHAIAEVLLNAIQANLSDAKVAVSALLESDSTGTNWVHIDVHDNGDGFSAAAMKKVPEPFFTTRNVGLGLGLTVTRKIIETLQGRLTIGAHQNGAHGV